MNKELDKEEVANEELVIREKIEDSPFTAVKIGDSGWAAGIGKHRLTEFYETKEEVIADVLEISWKRIVQVVSIMADYDGANKEKS